MFPSEHAEFLATIWNAIISKTKAFFMIFYSFLKSAWNLDYSAKKDEYPSLIISKIILSERGGYLNV